MKASFLPFRMLSIFLGLVLSFLSNASFAEEENAPSVILRKARETYLQVKDYTATFNRKERFGGKIKEEQGLLIQYKKPAYYYLHLPNSFTEIIYVQGQNDDQMVVYGKGILGFLRFTLPLEKALEHGRHTLLESNIGHILSVIEKDYKASLSDPLASISYEGIQQFDHARVIHLKAVFPKGKGYYAHLVDLFFHEKHGLPLKIVAYDWEGELLEDYEYKDLKLNVGLTPLDFRIKNVNALPQSKEEKP